MRSKPTDCALTTDCRGYPKLFETAYQRRSLRTARHRMDLIALLMLILATLLAGWSIHQSYIWHTRTDAAGTEALAMPHDESAWLQTQRWPHTSEQRQELASANSVGAVATLPPAHQDSAAESLPLARQDLGRTAPGGRHRQIGTASDYLLAAGVFLLALLCCAGSLRRAAAATQMTALLAAELFTLIGVGLLSALPAAL